MGQIDQVTNAYMSDKAHFADIFNYYIFNGEPVLSPDTLCEKDTTELVLPYGHSGDPERIRRVRDVFKYACAMEDEQKRAFILLGIEDQSHVHYAAPVKDLLYDAISYANQVDEISSAHRGAKDHTSKDEFLSGFHRDDQILPVITLMLYWSDKEWDGPLTLHEMMDLKDKRLARFVVNYKVNLISPSMINDFDKFRTELGEVLEYIKYSGDETALDKALKNNADFRNLDRRSAEVINTVTGSRLELPSGKERIDMCKAIEQMREHAKDEGRLQGIEQGIEQGRVQGIEQGIEQGRVQGIEQGRAQGIETAMLSSIKSLMKNMKLTAEQAMTALEIDAPEQAKYMRML